MTDKVEIGDAVANDNLAGTPRVRFSDGTSALLYDGRTVYLDVAGNYARFLSLEQQAHVAKQAGKFPEFVADTVEGKANQLVAIDEHDRRLSNAWRGEDNPAPAVTAKDSATAYAEMSDRISNGWKNP